MLAEPATGGPEPERERLRKDIFHRPGEIQRQHSDCSSSDSNPCTRPVETMNCSPGR